MFYFLKTLILISLIFVISCNKNLTEEEKKELWSKAQTTGEIINRSGTVFNPGVNKELALRDAETRLQTGGGLFGKKGLSLGNEKKAGDKISSTRIGMPLNQHLWQASLEVLDFIPLSSADPIGGVIITDDYSSPLFPGNQKAWIEFFKSKNNSPFLVLPSGQAAFIKQ